MLLKLLAFSTYLTFSILNSYSQRICYNLLDKKQSGKVIELTNQQQIQIDTIFQIYEDMEDIFGKISHLSKDSASYKKGDQKIKELNNQIIPQITTLLKDFKIKPSIVKKDGFVFLEFNLNLSEKDNQVFLYFEKVIKKYRNFHIIFSPYDNVVSGSIASFDEHKEQMNLSLDQVFNLN